MNGLISVYIKKTFLFNFMPYVLFLFFSSYSFAVDTDNHDHDTSDISKQNRDEHPNAEDEDAHKDKIILSNNEVKEFGIDINTAGNGKIKETLTLPGEITLDPERLIHIVPRVSGVTKNVYKKLGERVETGELLATLSSRELAEIRAELSAAKSRYNLSQVTFEREKQLKDEGLTSEREFLDAQQDRDNAYIEYNLSKQKLLAIGIDQKIRDCREDCDLTLYEIRSPGDGIITEKHIVQGELLDEESRPFIIANLDHVWVNLTVYQKDLEKIRTGQNVRIISGYGVPDVDSEIDYISPKVSEETRSASARIIIDNEDEKWRPGLFVSVVVTLSDITSDIVIPKAALETIDNQIVVFLKTDEGFETHPVKLGRSDNTHVEVLDGLDAGEQYVAKNAFVLKAQMQKATFGDGHGH